MAALTHKDHTFCFKGCKIQYAKRKKKEKEKHENLESYHLPLILPSKSAFFFALNNEFKQAAFFCLTEKIYMYIKSLHVHHIKTMCLNTVIFKSAS